MRISKNILTLILITVVVLAVWGFGRKGGQSSSLSPKVKGNPQAQIKIVEFIDFECPSCAKSALLIEAYLKTFSDKLWVEVKYFPLKGHKHGYYSAELSECVRAQELFWSFVEKILSRQADWREKDDAKPLLLAMAAEAGADRAKVDACMESGASRAAVDADRNEGEKLQIRSTPTLFVNGKRIVGFQLLEEELKKLLGPLAST